MKIRHSLCALVLLATSVGIFAYTRPNENAIQEAAQNLSVSEKGKIRQFIEGEMAQAAKQEQFQQASSYFEDGRYDMALQELQRLGVNLQERFNMTELRQKLITKELGFNSIPLWASEISALDYLFERDQRQKSMKKNWATVQDKVAYFFVLADELNNGHRAIPDAQLFVVRYAAKTVETKLSKAFNAVSEESMLNQIMQKMILVVKVQEARGIIKPNRPTVEPPEIIGPVIEEEVPVRPPAQAPKSGQTGIRYDPDAPTHTEEGHVIYY